MLDKRKIIAIAVVSFLILLILGGGAYYLYSRKNKKTALPVTPSPMVLSPAEQKQLSELDALRQEAGQKPLTQEDIKKQSEELDNLRQQVKGPSGAKDVSAQADELDKLRAQSK